MLSPEHKTKILHTLLFWASIATIAAAALLGIGAFSSQPFETVKELTFKARATSSFSVYFNMSPNEIYDKRVVEGDAGLPIYLSLTEEAIIRYAYSINEPVNGGSYKVMVLLEHPDGWSKIYDTREGKVSDGRVSETLRLDLPSIIDYMDNLSSQVGASKLTYTIRIESVVAPELELVDESKAVVRHDISLVIDKAKNRVNLLGNLTVSKNIEEWREKRLKTFIAGMDVTTARIVASMLGGAGAFALLVTANIYLARRRLEGEADKLEKKYHDLVIMASDPLDASICRLRVVHVSNAEELVKASRLLEKPIIRFLQDRGGPVYVVADKDTAFILAPSMSEKGGLDGCTGNQ